ncbi:MAG: hypothetical protein QNK84_02130 [Flavobacteriales bacterium]
MSEDGIASINEVIADYFKNNTTLEWIPAKEIMPGLIAAGVFYKDEKRGMPLRKVLRELDKEKALDKIPLLHAERKGIDTYWYFVREGAQYVSKDVALPETHKQKIALRKENSDEYYLVGLCNEILKEKAVHQHSFNYLLGDLHKDGRRRTRLPLDAFYFGLNMAIEFYEKGDEESDDAKVITVSNVKRSEQRKIYAQRKRDVLKEKGIGLVEMDYDEFECNEDNTLVRNKEADVKILNKMLQGFLK